MYVSIDTYMHTYTHTTIQYFIENLFIKSLVNNIYLVKYLAVKLAGSQCINFIILFGQTLFNILVHFCAYTISINTSCFSFSVKPVLSVESNVVCNTRKKKRTPSFPSQSHFYSSLFLFSMTY